MKRILPALLLAPCVSLASLYGSGGTEMAVPENEGDLPTGVRGDVKGASATLFIVQ